MLASEFAIVSVSITPEGGLCVQGQVPLVPSGGVVGFMLRGGRAQVQGLRLLRVGLGGGAFTSFFGTVEGYV